MRLYSFHYEIVMGILITLTGIFHIRFCCTFFFSGLPLAVGLFAILQGTPGGSVAQTYFRLSFLENKMSRIARSFFKHYRCWCFASSVCFYNIWNFLLGSPVKIIRKRIYLCLEERRRRRLLATATGFRSRRLTVIGLFTFPNLI